MKLPTKPGIQYAYSNTEPQNDDEETMLVERKPDGTYYAACGKYDIDAPTADAMIEKLTRLGYTTFAGME